jgi:hypothetical protein
VRAPEIVECISGGTLGARDKDTERAKLSHNLGFMRRKPFLRPSRSPACDWQLDGSAIRPFGVATSGAHLHPSRYAQMLTSLIPA